MMNLTLEGGLFTQLKAVMTEAATAIPTLALINT